MMLIEDPKPSEEIKPFKEKQLFSGHLVGRDSLLQFQQATIINPPEQRKEKAAKKSLFLKIETAVEVNEKRLLFLGNEDVPLMSQIQMDHTSGMDLCQDLLQITEEGI